MFSVIHIEMLEAIDLFSGIGGFSFTFKSQIKTILYVDTSKDCQDVLKSLMRKGYIDSAPVNDDVRSVTLQDFRGKNPAVIFAGFPCQDFSACNHKGKGLDGSRSSLFFEIVRICDEVSTVRHVVMENVSKLVKSGMINLVKKLFEEKGFTFSYVMVQAAQCGAPHLRRRCFMIATKDRDELATIRLERSNDWHRIPDNMIEAGDKEQVRQVRNRAAMCGNSIVPDCLRASFNFLVHSVPLPLTYTDYNVVLVDEEMNIIHKKKRWGTPYASTHLYYPYKKLTPRSTTVLYNQVYYQDKNISRRGGGWTINPRFVEWMMGYPQDYTTTTMSE